MRMNFESRTKSKDYVDEANNNLVFKKYFTNYIKLSKAYTDKKELANYNMPYLNELADELEFNLDSFEDYLQVQKVNYKRVDLVMKIQDILKARKKHGTHQNKSLVSWVIEEPDIENEDIILEGKSIDNNKELTNEFEKDRA